MSLESLMDDWPGERVVIQKDHPTGAWIFIAIHSTRLGPAAGGTRMKSYPDPASALRDAMRLAEGMTLKFAVPGLPYGGAKAVIALPEGFDAARRPDLLRRYGALVRELRGGFTTAPDVGTSSQDMDVIAQTGAPYIFSRTEEAGGSGPPSAGTALGVLAGIEVSCERLFAGPELSGRHVAVQGAGSVGAELIRLLRQAGARVSFTDLDEAAVRRVREATGAEPVEPESILDLACDLFAPCALGGVLNAETIPRLRCRGVAGAANNQLAGAGDAELLRQRGILYAPDYVINVGGAIWIFGQEQQGWTRQRTSEEITRRVRQGLQELFAVAASEGITTEAAARRVAESRLGTAL